MQALRDLADYVFYPGWPGDYLRYALIALPAYLLGSLNFAILLSRLVLKQDIRTHGSGNAGMTNAIRVMGKRLGIAVALGDIAKGAAAVWLGWLLAGQVLGLDPSIGKLVGGMFAVAGHCFPLYFRFKGGKGVLTTASVMVFMDWQIALTAYGVFILAVLLTRYVSVGSILAALSLIPSALWVFNRTPGFDALMVIIALGITFLHRKNIKRLLRGEEHKIRFHKKPPDKDDPA